MTTPDVALVLARLEVKLDQILAVSGDHEARLRQLESRRWPLPVLGAVTGAFGMLAALAQIVMK